MTIWTSLEPPSATVDAGGSTTVRLRLRNPGDVVDEYRVVPVGDPAPWTRVEPSTIRLYPGTAGAVELTFSPPRTPDATAGPNPYGVQVIPTEHPEATTVVEGNLTITPFTEVRAELVPPTCKGRFRGRPRLAVDNLGNVKLTASVNGSDSGEDLSFDIYPGSVQIEPGRAAFVSTTVRPRQITWVGHKEIRPFTLAVQRSGMDPLPVEGTYVQRGVFPRWMFAFLSVALALTITFIILWFSYKPQVKSLARENVAATAPPSKLPLPSTSPPAEKKPDKKPEGGGGGGGGGGAKPEPEETQQAPQGPLPFRPDSPPALYVQFAQLRLAQTGDDNPCKLQDGYTVGEMDDPTVKALACFQRANDERYGGVTIETDGPGNLGRSTMTALLVAYFPKDAPPSDMGPGAKSTDLVWFKNALMWAGQAEIDETDAGSMILLTAANIQALRGGEQATEEMTADMQSAVERYQGDVGIPVTRAADGATIAAMHAGRVKGQDQPGTVTAPKWPYPPME
ncbi:COG1470 family protein [Streptomyces sp. 8N706]|uniref:COG1470 family protein n=1 Tax=Streptomyces sp. 8N706 TaxID=3457416 RepID=UPI003FD4A750